MSKVELSPAVRSMINAPSGTLIFDNPFENSHFVIKSVDQHNPIESIPNFGLIVIDKNTHRSYHCVFRVFERRVDWRDIHLSKAIMATVEEFKEYLLKHGYTYEEYCFDPKHHISTLQRSHQLAGLLRSLTGTLDFNVRSKFASPKNNKLFDLYLSYDKLVRAYKASTIGTFSHTLDPTRAGVCCPKGIVTYRGEDYVFYFDSDSRVDLSQYANDTHMRMDIMNKFEENWAFSRDVIKWEFFSKEFLEMSLVDAYKNRYKFLPKVAEE